MTTETKQQIAGMIFIIICIAMLFVMTFETCNRKETNATDKQTAVIDSLKRENENLRAENRDYKLLRKVFGHKQIDDLLERAKSEKQSKQREKRFRNYKDER